MVWTVPKMVRSELTFELVDVCTTVTQFTSIEEEVSLTTVGMSEDTKRTMPQTLFLWGSLLLGPEPTTVVTGGLASLIPPEM